MSQYAYFNELPRTTEFVCNGTRYRKQSARTARIMTGCPGAGLTFYFGRRELCIVGVHNRLSCGV